MEKKRECLDEVCFSREKSRKKNIGGREGLSVAELIHLHIIDSHSSFGFVLGLRGETGKEA